MSAPRRPVAGLLPVLALAVGCDGTAAPPTSVDPPAIRVEALDSEAPLTLQSGRRSPALRFRLTDADGTPIPGARVRLAVEPAELGYLSQEVAIADEEGIAQSYLLEPRPGAGRVVTRMGDGSPEDSIRFVVERAPGSMEFEESSGAVGLPGLPHPDSILRVRVLDTEGDPMPGRQVLFSANGALSDFFDLTDEDGWAETRLRATSTVAGDGRVFAFVSGYTDVLAITERPTAAAARRVVLVSVDGLRTDAVARTGLTTFERLRSGGASGTLRTVVPSLTVPAHLSMLSGVPPAEHRVFSERLEFTPEMNALDPAFRLSVQRGGDTRAFMAAAGPLSEFEEILECRLAFGFERLETVAGGAPEIVDAALGAVADTALSAVFLHLPDPDRAGHAHGFTSPQYAAAIEVVDGALGRLLDALPEGTLLMVTSGHGGGGDYGDFQHGSEAEVDMEVPLFLFGPSVAAGEVLPDGSILDVAPTLVWSSGVATPPGYRGRPILAGFRNP